MTNRSFLSTRTFDGFRKLIGNDFQEIWIVDLGGDVRTNPKLSGTTHNVFGIQTGVAIAFLVRKKAKSTGLIHYGCRPELQTAEDKLSYMASAALAQAAPDTLKPNARGDWLNLGEEAFDAFLPVANSSTKTAVSSSRDHAIFKIYSLGVSTNRDEWVYDRSRVDLSEKIVFFLKVYDLTSSRTAEFADEIKWSENLKRLKRSDRVEAFDSTKIRDSLYRPFSKEWIYQSRLMIDRPGLIDEVFPLHSINPAIWFTTGGRLEFAAFATDAPASLTVLSLDANQCLARYRYAKSGERIDNITDWALGQFIKHYGKKGVTKDTIFHYVYAVLHDPVYRETYALNLKREFPRIPFYPNFARWAAWGKQLMAMHIGYEDVEPWPVERVDTPGSRAKGTHSKPILKSHPEKGLVVVDADTQITGIPAEAWTYRLGNRSAIDWVLDQHKEKKPRDPTIAAKFNTYRFDDYKESMIALLAKVVRVSIDTVAITDAMRLSDRAEGKLP